MSIRSIFFVDSIWLGFKNKVSRNGQNVNQHFIIFVTIFFHLHDIAFRSLWSWPNVGNSSVTIRLFAKSSKHLCVFGISIVLNVECLVNQKCFYAMFRIGKKKTKTKIEKEKDKKDSIEFIDKKPNAQFTSQIMLFMNVNIKWYTNMRTIRE